MRLEARFQRVKTIHRVYKSRLLPAFLAFLLILMGVLMFAQANRWSPTSDEPPHIVGGYTYLAKQEYRINPEHPPLLKMVSAFPLLLLDINFPSESEAWEDQMYGEAWWQGQWALGNEFLYESGNNPDSIMRWARLGPILLTLVLGFFIYWWTRRLYGTPAAFFALILFVFSPMFLAHGTLVTTDVAASLGFLAATYFFLNYLYNQNNKNLLFAGIALGLAQLLKFSLVLLVPYFFLITLLWVLFKEKASPVLSKQFAAKFSYYLGKLVLIGIVGLATIYPFYQYTIWNYSPERQIAFTEQVLPETPLPQFAQDGIIWMSDKPALRAYGQFFTGHALVSQRVGGGNIAYFMGEVSDTAWKSYFPIVFLIKTPTALLVLMGIAAFYVFGRVYNRNKGHAAIVNDKLKTFMRSLDAWTSKYFIEVSLFTFIVLYWAVSIIGNLNIGLRHILPTLPFLFILLAKLIKDWVKYGINPYKPINPLHIQSMVGRFFRKWIRFDIAIILLVWYMLATLAVYPNTLAYFNSLAGGPENAHNYVVDSNLDWGQDLKNLSRFVDENQIEIINTHYFGGGNPEHYLGEKYREFNPFDENAEEVEGWLAVSATFLQPGRAESAQGLEESTTHYEWLNRYEPVEKIGYSIFVYHIENNR